MANVILTQKIRDPRMGQERKWYSPFFITDDNKVHINGELNSENAVNTKNIATGAVTGNKIYSSQNNDDRPITKNHIKNGEITFEKLDPNTIAKNRINPNATLGSDDLGQGSVGSVQLQNYERDIDDGNRPVTSNSIRNGAITKNKIYATSIDDDRPVIENNIKNGSITYKKLYGSNNNEGIEDKKPVRGENIKKASVPLNRLSEPFYQMEQISGNERYGNYKLHLYPSSHLTSFEENPHWESVFDWRNQN